MDYTEITDEDKHQRDRACRKIRTDRPLRFPDNISKQYKKVVKDAMHLGNNTSYFCWNMLGAKPYAWQDKFWKAIMKNDKDVLACTPRQVGKSFADAVCALQLVTLNLLPIKSKGNKTVIGLVSKSDTQSKHLIAGVRELMNMGDLWLETAHNGEFRDFFKNRLSKKQEDVTNKTHLTFREPIKNSKGEWEAGGKILGEIIAIPATDSARGFTFSKLFMDEAAFFEMEDFYTKIAEPTLRATQGHSVVTTTPNGQKGWFFKTFDPFDENYKVNPNHRLWLHWKHIENDLEREAVLKKKAHAEKTGETKAFQQEYEASFTADSLAFFDPEKVDAMFDPELSMLDKYDKPTDLGIDVGFKTSRSVISISRLGEDGVIRRIWHYVYPKSDDLPIVKDVLALIPKFNVQRVIIDDCAAASSLIQTFTKLGVNLKLFTFKTHKTSKYVQFRAKMYQGLIKTYKDKKLEVEMKSLEEIDGVRNTRVMVHRGGSDDVIDSFLISVFFFLEEKKGFKAYNWNEL